MEVKSIVIVGGTVTVLVVGAEMTILNHALIVTPKIVKGEKLMSDNKGARARFTVRLPAELNKKFEDYLRGLPYHRSKGVMVEHLIREFLEAKPAIINRYELFQLITHMIARELRIDVTRKDF